MGGAAAVQLPHVSAPSKALLIHKSQLEHESKKNDGIRRSVGGSTMYKQSKEGVFCCYVSSLGLLFYVSV